MMSKTLFLAAVLGLAAFAAAEFPTEDGVLVLDDSNFDDALEAHDTLLVEFYAPWCGHCKKLAPEYSAAAAVLGEQDPPLFLAKVDAVANRDLGGRFDVQGFPTLKFFRNGKASEYGGGRTKKDIVQWVNKKSGPAAKTLDSADAAAAFVDASEVAVIGFFEDASSAEAKAFLAAAGANDDVAFGITTDADVAAANDASFPAVELFKKFDEGRASFSGDLTSSDELEAFVAGNSLPLVIPFSQEMAPKIFGGKIKTHLLVMGDNDAEYFAELSESVTAVAKANKGKILVITVGLDSQRVMGYFGVTEDDLPTAVLVNMPEGGQMKKYLYTEDSLTETGLNALVDGYFAGDLKPFLKSADPPASNDEPVKVVVGTTFEEIVLDPSKDVLLEFYAPWCGHCKSLAPIYEELAERFEDVSSIVIAKMDATANEVDYEGVNVSGFPTLKFFPAGEDKKVVDYTGARELDDFVTFIEKHATEKFALDAEAEL